MIIEQLQEEDIQFEETQLVSCPLFGFIQVIPMIVPVEMENFMKKYVTNPWFHIDGAPIFIRPLQPAAVPPVMQAPTATRTPENVKEHWDGLMQNTGGIGNTGGQRTLRIEEHLPGDKAARKILMTSFTKLVHLHRDHEDMPVLRTEFNMNDFEALCYSENSNIQRLGMEERAGGDCFDRCRHR